MSDKSHALEMRFTEMKSRVTVCSFLCHGSKSLQNASLLAELLSNIKYVGKWQNGDYPRFSIRMHFIVVLQILFSLVI